MILNVVVVGQLATNAYILGDEETGEGLLIDPGGNPDLLLDSIRRMGLRLKMVVATHAHPDHVLALNEVVEATGAGFALHRDELWTLENIRLFLLPGMVLKGDLKKPDVLLEDGDVIRVGKTSLRVIHTPGHTPGSICILNPEENVLFSGDTLFLGSIGRTDMPGGDYDKIAGSIKKIFGLPGETKVYPGHGPETTIADEKLTNPFVIELLKG